jgi:lipopolysaccharide export LptBFGC system permease protein LptF
MAVLRSGGMSTKILLAWLMPGIILITGLVGTASLSVTPSAKYALEKELVELQKRIGLSALQPGIFRIENDGDQVTYSNALDDDDQTILNVFIQRQLPDGSQMSVWAERGQRSPPDADGRQTLTLENGRRYVGKSGASNFDVMSFERLDMSIDSQRHRSTQTRSLRPTRYRHGLDAELLPRTGIQSLAHRRRFLTRRVWPLASTPGCWCLRRRGAT